MLETQRQYLLIEIINEQKFKTVNELSSLLNASAATIRRDIIKLSDAKRLYKIRGGAEALNSSSDEMSQRFLNGSVFLAEQEKSSHSKRAIAERACQMCDDGESVVISGGSSTYSMGEFIVKRDIGVYTNSFFMMKLLFEKGSSQVSVTNGEFYRKQGLIVSSFDEESTTTFHSAKIFSGTSGIGEYGVMETDPLIVRSCRQLRKQADQLIVLADGSKIGKRSNFVKYPITDVSTLITDSSANPDALKKIEDNGVEVIVVDL